MIVLPHVDLVMVKQPTSVSGHKEACRLLARHGECASVTGHIAAVQKT